VIDTPPRKTRGGIVKEIMIGPPGTDPAPRRPRRGPLVAAHSRCQNASAIFQRAPNQTKTAAVNFATERRPPEAPAALWHPAQSLADL
jgi:hypothetical protein